MTHAKLQSFLPVALLVVSAPDLGAQVRTDVVVPPHLAAAEGPASTLWAGLSVDARRQLVIDPQFFAGRAGESIVALSVRRDGNANAHRPGKIWLEAWLSSARTTSEIATETFAGNRGSDHVQVFAGYVSFSDVAPPSTKPAPWTAPHAISISLTQPFRYTGGALCLETVTRRRAPQDSTNPAAPWFELDADRRDPIGTVTRYGSSCIPSMPPDAAGGQPASMSLGSTARFNLRGSRASGLALFLLGTTRIDMSLDRAGAPGCALYVQSWLLQVPAAIVPLPGVPLGVALMDLRLPLRPELAGNHVYCQWLVIDPSANQLGLSLSNGVDCLLGPKTGIGVAWIESVDLAGASGRVGTDETPVLKVTFQRP